MSDGLRECLGLPEAREVVTTEKTGDFGRRFLEGMAALNRDLQLAAAQGSRAEHQPLDDQRMRLYEAFQKASAQFDPVDPNKGEQTIERVIAALTVVAGKASTVVMAVTTARDEWLKHESEFDDAMLLTGELEEAGHDKAPLLRKLGDAILARANDRKYVEAATALQQLQPKLNQIYSQHLRQRNGGADQVVADENGKMEPGDSHVADTLQGDNGQRDVGESNGNNGASNDSRVLPGLPTRQMDALPAVGKTFFGEDVSGATQELQPAGRSPLAGQAVSDRFDAGTAAEIVRAGDWQPPVLRAITISPANDSIFGGGKRQFTATGEYVDGSSQDITLAVDWSSSDAAVSIDANGLATALPVSATATIMATDMETHISATTHVTVSVPDLKSITISPAHLSLLGGEQRQFSATGIYADGSRHDVTSAVTWNSSAPDILSIDEQGFASSKPVSGTATIIASDSSGGASASAVVTVAMPVLKSITISPQGATLIRGTEQQLSARGVIDGSNEELKTVTWSSSAPDIVSISKQGVAFGQKVGSATIRATDARTMVRGEIEITVTEPILQAISIYPENHSILAGYQHQFSATGEFSGEFSRDMTRVVAWSSSAPFVTIDANGLATAQPVSGTAKVTATDKDSGVSASTSVTVTPRVELQSIAIRPTNPTIASGGKLQFSATGSYSDGSSRDLTKAVSWSSYSPDIVQIDDNGLATGKSVRGVSSTAVTARDATSGISIDTTVSVAFLKSITIRPANASLVWGGGQIQFTATGLYSDGSNLDLSRAVEWSSSDEGVFSIDNGGLATARHFVGNATLTVRDSASDVTASARIAVTPPVLKSIDIGPSVPAFVWGDRLQFTATGKYADGSGGHTSKTVDGVAWYTSAENIVTIDNDGMASARGVGTATVTAKDTSSDVSASIKIMVAGEEKPQAASGAGGDKLASYDKAKALHEKLRQQLRQLDDVRKRIEAASRPPRDILRDITNYANKDAVRDAEIAEGTKDALKPVLMHLKDFQHRFKTADSEVRLADRAVEAGKKKDRASELRARGAKQQKHIEFGISILGAAIEGIVDVVKKGGSPVGAVKPAYDGVAALFKLFHENKLVAEAESLEKEARQMELEDAAVRYGLVKDNLKHVEGMLGEAEADVKEVDEDYIRQRGRAEAEFDRTSRGVFRFADLVKGIELADAAYELAEQARLAAGRASSDTNTGKWRRAMFNDAQNWWGLASNAGKQADALRKTLRSIRVAAHEAFVNSPGTGAPRTRK